MRFTLTPSLQAFFFFLSDSRREQRQYFMFTFYQGLQLFGVIFTATVSSVTDS